MRQKVIMDVDTGCDDAVAMLLAGHHPNMELIAVTPVHGNAALSQTLDNTLRLLCAGKLEHVPVYAGASHPLIGPILAGDGDQVIKLPFAEPTIKPQPEHAVNFPDRLLHERGGQGYNLHAHRAAHQPGAGAAHRTAFEGSHPSNRHDGGAYATSFAEFNIKADPEAAFIVYSAGIPIKMIGLEVTDVAQVMQKDVDAIRKINTPWAIAAADVMDIVVDIHTRHFGQEGAIIFDACAVAAVIEPSVVKTEPMHVDIELTGTHTRGCTVTGSRVHGAGDKKANVDVGISIDRDRFIQIIHESLQ
jgi:inosine-uridine nucleoside N-ribohydrolase